jgi:metal-responsive CopG/Arc/MetJ family transcriptional regulator
VFPYRRLEGITLKYEPVDDSYVVKTTIDIPDDKWKRFSIKVIEEYGGRKKNDVIEDLIDEYLKEKRKDKK